MVFQQKPLEKGYFIFRITGPAMVWPVISNFWKVLKDQEP